MEPLKGDTVEPMSIGTLDELDGAASARRRRRCRVAAGACALLFMATLALRVVATRKPEDTQNIDGPANYMQPVQTVGLLAKHALREAVGTRLVMTSIRGHFPWTLALCHRRGDSYPAPF